MQTAMDASPSLLVLAKAESSRGNFPQALSYIDRSLERVKERFPPKLQEAHLTRGDILARMGRNDEAEHEFRAEIADFPADPRAYSSLVMLQATEGRLDDGTKTIFEAIKASPGPHTYAVVAETLKALGDDRGAMFWVQQGLAHYPQNGELRELPGRLAKTRLN
ncbi:MAG TPA: tetratricopeptide repeat protein [Thermoanaerobaculia bacterium]